MLFFFQKRKNPEQKKKRLREAQCEDHTAPTEVGTVTYCTLEETDGPSETEEAVKKGAEKHAGLQFGINVKGLAIHSRTGKKEEEKKEKNQAQETCPEIKRDCWREQDVLQKNKIMIFYIYSCRELQD